MFRHGRDAGGAGGGLQCEETGIVGNIGQFEEKKCQWMSISEDDKI